MGFNTWNFRQLKRSHHRPSMKHPNECYAEVQNVDSVSVFFVTIDAHPVLNGRQEF